MALTQDVVLSFLLERGGRVRNTELLSAFTAHINCSAQEDRRRNRDAFKNFINNVAVVKRVGEVKYVVVKKKYQDMTSEGKSSWASSSSPSSSSSSSSSCAKQQRNISKSETRTITSADVLNNNSLFCTSPPGSYANDLVTKQQYHGRTSECDAAIAPVSTSDQDESLTARVLNVANDTRYGKTEAVFAVVGIKSRPRAQSEKINVNPRMPACHQSFEVPPELEMIPYLSHESDLNKSPKPNWRQMEVRSSPVVKREYRVGRGGFGSKDSPAFRLEPREHEWLVKTATGCWSQLFNFLLQDVHLAEKRNFISGFTALHWAAKHGSSKTLHRILDVGKKVDVNIKSHDGYTPLHVAAIHGHESVLNVLVREYGANCNIRDNSGKKAYQYLCKDLSVEVRELLGDPAVSCQAKERACSDDQHFSDLSKNLNTFSKLFQASVGYMKKSRHRSIFRLNSYEKEENRKDCTLDH